MEPLDTVGKFIALVRDRSIASANAALSGELRSARGQQLSAVATALRSHERELLVAAVVDDVLVSLLAALEETDSITLQGAGQSAKEVSDGLAGELFGEAGWIARFSQHAPSA